jgi:hypothetical protein
MQAKDVALHTKVVIIYTTSLAGDVAEKKATIISYKLIKQKSSTKIYGKEKKINKNL